MCDLGCIVKDELKAIENESLSMLQLVCHFKAIIILLHEFHMKHSNRNL